MADSKPKTGVKSSKKDKVTSESDSKANYTPQTVREQFGTLRNRLASLLGLKSEQATGISKAATFQRRQAIYIGAVLGSVIAGFLAQTLALALPEWFILRETENVIRAVVGHVGFFHRCIYGPVRGSVRCYYEITKDAAAPLTMMCIGVTSAGCAILYAGIRISVFRKQGKARTGEVSNFLKQLRTLIAISSFSNLTAMLIFTYLYNTFLSSIGACYGIAWVSTILLLAATGMAGYFSWKTQPNAKSAVGPLRESKILPDRCASADEGVTRPSRRSQNIRSVDRQILYKGSQPLHGKARLSCTVPI